MEVKYLLRNDFVLVRIIDLGFMKGIAMPQSSINGKQFVVEALGPDVETLKVGDKVLMLGNVGVTAFPLPNANNLIVLKQEYIALVIEGDESEAPAAPMKMVKT
jgi:NADPH:quinone reductase-like Zn-dependent oxidoreductase